MENSDSGGEGDESEAQGRSQMDRAVQEEDSYQFVNDLSGDDYKPMRDNDLLGNPGEELGGRCLLSKEDPLENSDESTDEGDHSDDASSSDSLLDWLMSLEPTENVTTGQREQLPRRKVSQVNLPSNFRSSSEISELALGGPNAGDEYTPSTRLPRGGNVKNSQSQAERPQSEPRFTRPPRSEQSRPGALLEGLPTRGQKRERSRSPDHSRTRARFESTPLPHSLSLHSQRPQHSPSSLRSGSVTDQLNSATQAKNVTTGQREHQRGRDMSKFNPHSDFRSSSEINVNFNNRGLNAREAYTPFTRPPTGGNMKNSQSQVGCPQSEPRFTRPPRSEQSRPGALLEGPPTRGQKRERSRSPDHSRTRASTESRSPAQSLGELLPRLHHSASSPTFEQPVVRETERFSRTQHHETLRQQITARELQKRVLFANSEIRNAIQGESSPDTTRDGESCHLRQMNPTISFYSETGRVYPVAYSERESVTRTQIPSETPNHTITLESEQEVFGHMFSHYEQGDMRYVSTIGIPIYRTLNTGLNDTTSGAIPSMLSLAMTDFSYSSSLLDSDSDSEPSLSPPSPNTERAESISGSDSSHGSRGSGSHSTCSYDYCPRTRLISSSDSSYTSSSTSSPMSSSSSGDESSEPLTVLFESSDEGDDDHPMGLSEAQIDNLAIRSSVKNDILNECSICITEYREGSQLRILPCSHEFHVHCIDRWLSDNSTCPICRRNIVDSAERENTN